MTRIKCAVLVKVPTGTRFQSEWHGYFVTDRKGHAVGKAVFNRIAGTKGSWRK